MDVLPLHFRVLYYGGLWWETDEQHWFAKYIWKPLIISIILFCAILMIDPLAAPDNDIKDVPQFLFLSLTVFGLVFKMINFLAKRKSMIELLNIFRQSICMPQTREESEILRKNAQIIPTVFKFYLYMAYTSITIFIVLPLVQVNEGIGQMNFPYETYEIFSRGNVAYFTITYAFQVIASIIGTTMHAALDTIFAGFACLACGQIDLCCHRFASGDRSRVSSNIKLCVLHHVVIQNIVRGIESIFMNVVLPFFLTSLVTICTSVYNLSQSKFASVEIVSFLVYAGAILAQVFFYCWFGNEIKLKGIKISETLYDYDWRALTLVERKNLLYIMIVCQKPMNISYYDYCTISLDIYVWILNTSYAAYNILHKITNDN